MTLRFCTPFCLFPLLRFWLFRLRAIGQHHIGNRVENAPEVGLADMMVLIRMHDGIDTRFSLTLQRCQNRFKLAIGFDIRAAPMRTAILPQWDRLWHALCQTALAFIQSSPLPRRVDHLRCRVIMFSVIRLSPETSSGLRATARRGHFLERWKPIKSRAPACTAISRRTSILALANGVLADK